MFPGERMGWQMKKIKWKRVIVPAVVIVLLVSAVLLVVANGASKEVLTDRYSTAPALTGKVDPDAETALLTKGGLSLYLEPNMAVRVEDANGAVWSTNGHALDGSETVGQFKASYYTANAAFSYMESQADSVDRQQATAFVQDDTLYVQYQLGDYGKTADAVPQYLKNDRMTELFLENLSAEDAETMESFYKYYKDDDAWRIRPKGRNNFEQILVFMEQVGYTDEDLVSDNADGGIATEAVSKPWFTIVLAYTLTDVGLSVSMPSERIEFNADFPLYEVELLPHFGRVDQSEDGYVLLPDGSGALMRFMTDYSARTEYTIPIYELDWSVASDTLSTGQYQYESASLPIFGMKDGSAAYLAVIEGAATKATLHFHPAGEHFERNAVYPTFRMINKDSVYLSGSDNSSKVIVFESSLDDTTCSVHYQFLAENSGYTEMAALYRTQLEEDGLLTSLDADTKVSLLLETIGGVQSDKNFLGVSYEGLTAATTYEQNKLLAEDLLENGVDALDMRLIGWFNDGYYHGYAGNVSLESVLGGKSDWNALRDYAAEAGIGLYPDVDFQRVPSMAWGFFPSTDSASRLDAMEAKYSVLSRALLLEKEDIGLTPSDLYLLSPKKFTSVAESFLNGFKSIQTEGLSLRSTRVYSDFDDKNMISRPEALTALTAQLETLSAKTDLLVENGAQYTFAYTQKMTGVAADSSHYRIADETVPFLQMVLHGSMELYTAPINLASNAETAVLKAIEYGMLPNYQVTYEDSSVLKNSEYSDNYASGYSRWREDILAAYAMADEALNGLIAREIVAHTQVAEQVYATTYDSGDTVYVNYSQSDVTVGEKVVPARGVYRERGEQ